MRLERVAYFFLLPSSSALAFARFSRTPTRRASERASRSFLNAFSSPLKSLTAPSWNSTTFLMGSEDASLATVFSPLLADLMSSAEASPCLVLPLRRGKRIRRLWNSWRRSTLALRPSSDRFWRRGSTEMPMVRANLRGMPAALSSTREKPRPALSQLCDLDPIVTRCVPSRTRRLSTSAVSVALLPRNWSTYT